MSSHNSCEINFIKLQLMYVASCFLCLVFCWAGLVPNLERFVNCIYGCLTPARCKGSLSQLFDIGIPLFL